MDLREASLILGVPEGASKGQVTSAFRSKAKLVHPNQFAEGSAEHVAAEAEMKRLNEAKSTFDDHLKKDGNLPVLRREPTAEFDALLHHRHGLDLNGVLRIDQVNENRVAVSFRSDDTDGNGTPVVDEVVPLDPGTKASRDGRLTLRDGGYLIIHGGKVQADRVMAYVNGVPPEQPKGVQLQLSGSSIGVVAALLILAAGVAAATVFLVGKSSAPPAAGASSVPVPVVTVTQPPPIERTVTATATATATETATATPTATKAKQTTTSPRPSAPRPSAPRSEPPRTQSEQDTAAQLMQGMNSQDWAFVNALCDPSAVCQQQFTDFFADRFARGQWLSVEIGPLYSCASSVRPEWERLCTSGADWLADFRNTCSKNGSVGIDQEVARFRFTGGSFPYIEYFDSAYAPPLPPECA